MKLNDIKIKNNAVKSALLLTAFALVSCNSEKQESAVEGKVKKEVISFAPKITGRILEIYVEEGQTVKAGDTLAKIDAPEISAKIAQAQGARNGATANQLSQLRAKERGLREQYEYAQKSYNRATNMFKDSLMSPQAYDEVIAKYQGAKAQYDAVIAELRDVENGTRYERISMAAGQAEQAAGALQEAKVAYSERYVIATSDMEIESITLHKGELATAGFALFNGYLPESTYFRFTVPEGQIAKYQKGQTVNMEVVYNKAAVSGKIMTIKQLTKYADVTTAFPDYKMQEAVYEIKVKPQDIQQTKNILVNSNVILK